MGKNKAKKKATKAKYKLAKKKAEPKAPIPNLKSSKWYKNPDWIRAIVAIISVIIAIMGILWIR